MAETEAKPIYKRWWFWVFWVVVLLVALYAQGLSMQGDMSNSRARRDSLRRAHRIEQREQSVTDQPITQSSPTWAKMAVIHSGSRRPPADILDRFRRSFSRLESHCPDTPERIGNIVGNGQRLLRDRGNQTSLLELTEAVATMLDTAVQSGGIPEMKSCAEPVALMVTMLLAQ